MNLKCRNCKFARYTVHIEKVGCAYWSSKHFENNPNITDEDRNRDMTYAGIDEAWIGWIYSARSPERTNDKDLQLGEGIMANNSIIINENNICSKYKTN